MDLSEGEAVILEIVGITSSGGEARMCEFALGTVSTKVEQLFGNGAVEDKIAAVESTCILVKVGNREPKT